MPGLAPTHRKRPRGQLISPLLALGAETDFRLMIVMGWMGNKLRAPVADPPRL